MSRRIFAVGVVATCSEIVKHLLAIHGRHQNGIPQQTIIPSRYVPGHHVLIVPLRRLLCWCVFS